MGIVGIVPGAKHFVTDDLYADQYVFVNSYGKRIAENGGTPVGVLSSDGYIISRALELCDSFVVTGGARFSPIIFRSWNTRRRPESACWVSALACR